MRPRTSSLTQGARPGQHRLHPSRSARARRPQACERIVGALASPKAAREPQFPGLPRIAVRTAFTGEALDDRTALRRDVAPPARSRLTPGTVSPKRAPVAARGRRRLSRRAPRHRHAEAAVAEQSRRRRFRVVQRHGADTLVALGQPCARVAVELHLHQLPRNFGRGVEAQRIGADQGNACPSPTPRPNGVGRHVPNLLADHVERFARALVLGGRAAGEETCMVQHRQARIGRVGEPRFSRTSRNSRDDRPVPPPRICASTKDAI